MSSYLSLSIAIYSSPSLSISVYPRRTLAPALCYQLDLLATWLRKRAMDGKAWGTISALQFS